jgi:hypothetical protein
MTALLLAQELFLLAHQEESAKACLHPRSGQRVGWGAPGEFASEELVAADGRALTALVGAPWHPLLASVYAELLQSDRPRTAQHWVNRLARGAEATAFAGGSVLAERGVLAEQPRRVLGLFPATSWPEVDPEPEGELRHRLTCVVVEDALPDPRTAYSSGCSAPSDWWADSSTRNTASTPIPARRTSPVGDRNGYLRSCLTREPGCSIGHHGRGGHPDVPPKQTDSFLGRPFTG